MNQSGEVKNSGVRRGFEVFSNILQDNRTRLLALDIWGSSLLYNLIHQHQPIGVSALHGLANMANSPLYPVDFHEMAHLWDYVGLGSQTGMYLVAGIAAGNLVSKAVEHELKRIQGELPIKKIDAIILADYGKGLPLFDPLSKALLQGEETRLDNVILAHVDKNTPSRSPTEKNTFSQWSANSGTISEAWLDSTYWERSGAKKAKLIILNTDNTSNSLLAAGVIRRQLENNNGEIIIIDNDHELKHLPNNESHVIYDEKTDSTLINPYFEIASNIIKGLKDPRVKNSSIFMPHDGKKRPQESQNLIRKLMKLKGKPRIFLDGLTEDGEGKGLKKALSFFLDDVEIVNEVNTADVVLHFGSGEITNDEEALKRSENSSIPIEALHLSIVFFEDNEDTALLNHDGAVSMQYAVNDRLREMIEPYVKASTPILSKLNHALIKK